MKTQKFLLLQYTSVYMQTTCLNIKK